MAKLPAIQFYPGDWRKDVGVQSLTFHDRGVWFEVLMLMHESERRGVLTLNGRAMSDEVLARLLGLDKQILTTTLSELLTSGVASREEDTGALLCRRMVRDEQLRKVRSDAGSLGGNPVLLKQKPTTRDKQIPTPSSSSSVSTSKTTAGDEFSDHSIAGRVLAEECGVFDLRKQEQFCRLLKATAKPDEQLKEVVDRMVCQWKKYNEARDKLNWTNGNAATFFDSGTWQDEKLWPWKDGMKTVAARKGWRPDANPNH